MNRTGGWLVCVAAWALWPAASQAGWWRRAPVAPATTHATPTAPPGATPAAQAPAEPVAPPSAVTLVVTNASIPAGAARWRAKAAELDSELAARGERIALLEKDLERAREEAARAHARADALAGVPQALLEGLRTLLQAETVEKRDLAKWARRFPDLEPLLGWLAETVLTREEGFRKRDEELTRVREEYAAARREFGNAQAELLKRVERAGQAATESMQRREALVRDLSAARATLRETEKALAAARSEAETAVKERANLAESVAAKDAQIETLRARTATDRQQAEERATKQAVAAKEAVAARDAALARDRRLAEAGAGKLGAEVETLRRTLRERERAAADQQAEAQRLRAALEADLRITQEQLALAMERQSDLRRRLSKIAAATPAAPSSAASPPATDGATLSEIEAEMRHVRSALEGQTPPPPDSRATATDAATDAERKKRIEDALRKAKDEVRHLPPGQIR